VQTGKHGEQVGSLLVDIEPGKPLQVLSYELVPVTPAPEIPPTHHELDRRIAEAGQFLERDYGAGWLYEQVGLSEVPLGRPEEDHEPTVWNRIVTRSLREAAGADVSLDIDEFNGNTEPPGPVTRLSLMRLYPRQFEFSQRLGWTIWTNEVAGWILKAAIEQAVKLNAPFRVDGATWEVTQDSKGRPQASNIRIGGSKIKLFKSYRLAVPEGIGRGAVEIFTALQLFLRKPRDTGIPIWTAIEDHIRRLGVIRAGRSH
jgi:hypothetical protein